MERPTLRSKRTKPSRPSQPSRRSRPSQTTAAGFTIVEMAVALGVMLVVMLGVLLMFDFNNKLTRVQTHVAEMQQSLRIAQYDMVRLTRMTGRGSLPQVQPGLALPTGVAVSLRNNVGTAAHIVATDTASPKILPGTDVLTLRGVFSTPVYQINYAQAGTYTLVDPVNPVTPRPQTATGGTIQICSKSPSGIDQDMAVYNRLIDQAAADATKAALEALVLVSPLDDSIYAVVQLNPLASTKTAPTCATGVGVTLAFLSDTSPLPAAFRLLGPGGGNLPPGLTSVAFVGILEEYRFYVREEHEVETNPASDLMPVLARARFYPGTQRVYQNDNANLRADVADGILDLQVALGIDVNNDGRVVENTADPGNDEWLGNAAGEPAIAGRLAYARLNTLARTARRDRDYAAPVLNAIEDHAYTVSPSDPLNGPTAIMFRRRLLQTIVDMRNLS